MAGAPFQTTPPRRACPPNVPEQRLGERAPRLIASADEDHRERGSLGRVASRMDISPPRYRRRSGRPLGASPEDLGDNRPPRRRCATQLHEGGAGTAALEQSSLPTCGCARPYRPALRRADVDRLLRRTRMPEPDVFLGIGSAVTGSRQPARSPGSRSRDRSRAPDLVVVAGDVNSTLAGALAAVKLDVPVAHLEAGLRSYDRTMPEEHNRRLTDAVSSVLLTHSEEALDNLSREGVDPATVHLVGNTMIDSLLEHLPRAFTRAPWQRLGLAESDYALVTLHRPALVDDPDLLRETIDQLHELGRTFPSSSLSIHAPVTGSSNMPHGSSTTALSC